MAVELVLVSIATYRLYCKLYDCYFVGITMSDDHAREQKRLSLA